MNRKNIIMGIFSVLTLGLLASLTKGSWYSSIIDVGDPDLVAYWNLSSVNATNYTLDSSYNGLDGLLTNFVCDPADCNLTTARYGNGIFFSNTTTNYINVGTDSRLDFGINDFSVSFWMKIEQEKLTEILGKKNDVGGNNAGYLFGYNTLGSSKVEFQVANGTTRIRPTAFIGNNNWNHYVGVKNSTHASIYVNGILITSSSLGSENFNVTDNTARKFTIGNGDKLLISRGLNGTIDEIRTYNRSLSDAEIKELYSCRTPDSGGWIVNGNCNIDSEDINKPTLSLDIASTGTVNMINTNLTVDKITIANGGQLIKDNDSAYYIV